MNRFPEHGSAPQADEEDLLLVYIGDLSNATLDRIKTLIFDELQRAPEACELVDGRARRLTSRGGV